MSLISNSQVDASQLQLQAYDANTNNQLANVQAFKGNQVINYLNEMKPGKPISNNNKVILGKVHREAIDRFVKMVSPPSEAPQPSMLQRTIGWAWGKVPTGSNLGSKVATKALDTNHYAIANWLQQKLVKEVKVVTPWYLPRPVINTAVASTGIVPTLMEHLGTAAPIVGGWGGTLAVMAGTYAYRLKYGTPEEQAALGELKLINTQLNDLLGEEKIGLAPQPGEKDDRLSRFFLRSDPNKENYDQADCDGLAQELATIFLTGALLNPETNKGDIFDIVLPYIKRLEDGTYGGNDGKPFTAKELVHFEKGLMRLTSGDRLSDDKAIERFIKVLTAHVNFASVYKSPEDEFVEDALLIENSYDAPQVTMEVTNLDDSVIIEYELLEEDAPELKVPDRLMRSFSVGEDAPLVDFYLMDDAPQGTVEDLKNADLPVEEPSEEDANLPEEEVLEVPVN